MVRIETATGCAWRAFYVKVLGRKVFYLGFDPEYPTKCHLFGGLGIDRLIGGKLYFWDFRKRLPMRLARRLYRFQGWKG
jgi:hypothetical protein